ncbi:hypothetical protein [Halanaeroarchaeum sulfurireducens]|nr:hypothetical protein [Halanaeroarchaeum sulfurireducens]
MSQSTPTYEAHLDTADMPLDLTSPVRPVDVLFYDSGIWLVREQDRVFVPYRHVNVVREVDESPEDDTTEP